MLSVASPPGSQTISRFVEFTRAEWARFRLDPLPLSEAQLKGLVSLNEPMSLGEVSDIYLPLSRLLNLYVGATQELHRVTGRFLGSASPRVPFIVGVAGSVAGGRAPPPAFCRRCCRDGQATRSSI